MFLPFCTFPQNILVLNLNVVNDDTKEPLIYKEVTLYCGASIMDCPFMDDEGNFTLIIDDTVSTNTDSIYFSINVGDTSCKTNKIFINQLKLLESNKIGCFLIKILRFEQYTPKEYDKYCKKNGIMPRRKKTLAKDVIW